MRSLASRCAFLAGARLRFWPILSLVRRLLRHSSGPLRAGWSSRWIAAVRIAFEPNNIRRNRSAALAPNYRAVTGLLDARYVVDVNDHVGWTVFLKGYFDLTPIAVAALLDELNPGGTYIDVGANIGSTSIPVALLGIPTVGIEASPRIAGDLARNVSLNSPLPYTVLNLAASSPHPRERHARIFSSAGNAAASSFFPSWNPSVARSTLELVRLVTLDEVIACLDLSPINSIKLDIEGAEFMALEGLRQHLGHSSPCVLFEWRPDRLDRSGLPRPDLRAFFPSQYTFHAVSSCARGDTIEVNFTTFDDDRSYENVLAAPESAAIARLAQAGTATAALVKRRARS